MSLAKIFSNDYEYIQKAVWFIEKSNDVEVTDKYDNEWNELNELYDEEQTLDLFKRLHLHYPSVMTLVRILHPEVFDKIIIDRIYEKVINNLIIGRINMMIINYLVDEFTDIINWNGQSKELFVLCKNVYTCQSLSLKWTKVSDSFSIYIMSLFENIIDKIIEYVDENGSDPKEIAKIKSEVSKLPSAKYVQLFYAKNEYKRHSTYTHSFTQPCNNMCVFKNGYLNIDEDEFICSIAEIFDENNQCMNIEWKQYDESNMSSDIVVKYILSMINKMFYNQLPKVINIVYGLTSRKFISLFENLFGSYVTRTSLKDFISKGNDIHTKFVMIDAPADISLNAVYNKLKDKQYAILDCSNNQFPKFTGSVNTDKINIFSVDYEIFNKYTVETFFADMIYADEEVAEPFNNQIIKESLLNEINSAEYFCRACMLFDDENEEEMYTEIDLYKRYVSFCKANKLIVNTITGFINVIYQQINVKSSGVIGSRIFSGFRLRT